MREDLFGLDLAADYIDKSKPTMAKWRHLGIGPRYVKIGKRVFYRKRDLDEYIDSHIVEPVAQGGAR